MARAAEKGVGSMVKLKCLPLKIMNVNANVIMNVNANVTMDVNANVTMNMNANVTMDVNANVIMNMNRKRNWEHECRS